MNAKLVRAVVVIVLLSIERGLAQGSFVNLDFESPILPLTPDVEFKVATSNGIPGWTAYAGAGSVERIFFNTVSIGAAAVSLHDTNSSLPPVQGIYSVIIQSSSGGPPVTAAVGQTGQIPVTAKSLLFYGTGVIQVSFAGQPISLVQLSNAPNYSILGADISGLAGQTGELKFLMPNLSFNAMSYLDNIQFSDQLIPEPSTIGLFVFSGLLLGFHRRRNST